VDRTPGQLFVTTHRRSPPAVDVFGLQLDGSCARPLFELLGRALGALKLAWLRLTDALCADKDFGAVSPALYHDGNHDPTRAIETSGSA
jgi:hypothetical protein